MARYQVAFTTVAAAAGAGLVDVLAGTDRVHVLELCLTNVAATSATFELGRSTTLGTQTTPQIPEKGDPADSAALAKVATAWSVAPASTGVPIRGITTPANIGGGVIWTFGYGDLLIAPAAALVVINRGAVATGIMRGYFVLDE